MKDTIVESVIQQFRDRSEVGINKYGTTLDRTDLNRLDWINHAQQEAMDLILYLEKLKTYQSLKDCPKTQYQPYIPILVHNQTY